MSNTKHGSTSAKFRREPDCFRANQHRRFTRLTSAFHKKVGNPAEVAVLACGVLYNFCRALRSDGFRLKAASKCARLVSFKLSNGSWLMSDNISRKLG